MLACLKSAHTFCSHNKSAGTYFPPTDSFGRPGFQTVLRRIAGVWGEKKEEVKGQSAQSMKQLADLMRPEPSPESLTAEQQGRTLDLCASQLSSRFDPRLGGFGSAPKFPRPAEINALLAQHARLVADGDTHGAARVLHLATFSLQRMAAGGMWDHVGGGFHRYSVDDHWHVPHFEKMLYDNPQLASTYLAAFQITGDVQYAGVARGIFDYLLRDMTHPEGGLFSAEDADSLDPGSGEKKEGWFYVWSQKEIEELLGPEEAKPFCAHYYVKPGGNCDLSPRSDPHQEFGGLNCLIARQTLAQTAAVAGKSEAETAELLAACREKLFRAREQRPRPMRDDKIVTAWNGMAISAYAQASRALAHEQPPAERCFPVEGRTPSAYLEAALKAASFVRTQLYDTQTGLLYRSYMRERSSVKAFADDYAYTITGLLDLYAATGDTEHLQWATELQGKMDELFWDAAAGGYFNNAEGDESILLRLKEDYDGAEPGASSIALANLWYLAGLSGTEEAGRLRERASKTAAAFAERLQEMPVAMPQMAAALHLLTLGHPRQVIIAGKRGAPGTEALLDAVFAAYTPDKVVIHLDPSDPQLMEYWRGRNPEAVAVVEATGFEAGKPATAFVCQSFTCKAPTTCPEKVKQLLTEPRASAAAKPVPVSLPTGLGNRES